MEKIKIDELLEKSIEIFSFLSDVQEIPLARPAIRAIQLLKHHLSIRRCIKLYGETYRIETYESESFFPTYPANLSEENFILVENELIKILNEKNQIINNYYSVNKETSKKAKDELINKVVQAGRSSDYNKLSELQREEQRKVLKLYALVLLDAVEYIWENDPLYVEEIRQRDFLESIVKEIKGILVEDEKRNKGISELQKKEIIQCIVNCWNKKSDFEQLIDGLNNKYESNNPFHYLNPNINIYGREDSLRLLDDFLNIPNKLMFWAITGPGGVGKSKLAYSFIQRHSKDHEWKMVFLPSSYLKKILAMTEWNYHQNLLIIIDYAGSISESIGDWLQRLASKVNIDSYKIRLLLLERQSFEKVYNEYTEDKIIISPEWYKRLCAPRSEGIYPDESYIQELQYGYSQYKCMLILEGLKKEDYIFLMDDYAKVIRKEPLGLEEKKNVIAYVKKSIVKNKEEDDKELPLYVLFATDAALSGKNYNNWDIMKMMSHIYERNWKIWEKSFAKSDDELLNSLVDILIYTTAVRKWRVGEKLPEVLCTSEAIVNKYRIRNGKDLALDWINILTGQVLTEDGDFIMGALEPDLVGEYFVLRRLSLLDDAMLESWGRILFKDIVKCREFFLRCLTDFKRERSFIKLMLKIFRIMLKEANIHYLSKIKNSSQYYIIQMSTLAIFFGEIWKINMAPYSGEAKNNLGQIACTWIDLSQDIAEIYAQVFLSDVNIKGQQKKRYFNLADKLYKQWPQSCIITEIYVNLLGEVAVSQYGAGQIEKGDFLEKELQQVVETWGTQNEEVAKSCVNAFGKLIPAQYSSGKRNVAIENAIVMRELSDNWNNENFSIYFIETLSNMVIAQFKVKEFVVGKETIKTLCHTIEKWGAKSDIIAWRTADVVAKIIIFLYQRDYFQEGDMIVENICGLITELLSLSKGIIWHWINALNRIANMQGESCLTKGKLEMALKQCYGNLKW